MALDWAAVLDVASENAKKAGVADRVRIELHVKPPLGRRRARGYFFLLRFFALLAGS